MVVLLRQPSQDFSPLTVVRFAATALASSSVRSKSPRMHSPLGQLKRKTDLALARFTVYLTWLVLDVPSGSKKLRSTVSDFNFAKRAARLRESLTRWLSNSRCSKRAPVLCRYMNVQFC